MIFFDFLMNPRDFLFWKLGAIICSLWVLQQVGVCGCSCGEGWEMRSRRRQQLRGWARNRLWMESQTSASAEKELPQRLHASVKPSKFQVLLVKLLYKRRGSCMWLCPYVSRLLILLGNFNQMSVKLLNTVKVLWKQWDKRLFTSHTSSRPGIGTPFMLDIWETRLSCAWRPDCTAS